MAGEEDHEGPIAMCCGQTKAQLDDLTDKYNNANIKLCELRNQNQHLRHEYKLALKVKIPNHINNSFYQPSFEFVNAFKQPSC